MAGSGRNYCPNICLENWGEEPVIEVADLVAKKETPRSRIQNKRSIRWIKLSGTRHEGTV